MAFPFWTRSLHCPQCQDGHQLVQSQAQRSDVHKLLVIGVAENMEVRADFEDEMAFKIARPGIETIPRSQIHPKAKPDLDYLRGQRRDNQIDAVIVSRLLKVDKKVISIPSSTYIAPFP